MNTSKAVEEINKFIHDKFGDVPDISIDISIQPLSFTSVGENTTPFPVDVRYEVHFRDRKRENK